VPKLSRAGEKAQALAVLDAQKDLAAEMDADFTDYGTYNAKLIAAVGQEAADAYGAAHGRLLALTAVALLAGAAIAFLIARRIVGAVRRLRDAARGIAEGDVDQSVRIASRDELGETAAAFDAMVDYLKTTAQAAERIGAGDLSTDVTVKGERDALGSAFAAMTGSLRQLVGDTRASAATVAAASEQLTDTSGEATRAVEEVAVAIGTVAAGAETQVRHVTDAQASLDETVAAVATSAGSAERVAGITEQARELAGSGMQAAEEASEAMRGVRATSQEAAQAIGELAQKAERIGDFVTTITQIPEQTNLLALNAAIEAARAGEQGRGFAVVAEEVRKLAEGAQDAAGTIEGLVREIHDDTARTVGVVDASARRTDESADLVDRTREAFERIGAAVEEASSGVGSIAAAMQQLAASGERVQEQVGDVAQVAEETSATAEQVSAATQQTSASAQEIAASAQELAQTAKALEGLVHRFTLAA
jgi:methyl-accepting chemotaxis protein